MTHTKEEKMLLAFIETRANKLAARGEKCIPGSEAQESYRQAAAELKFLRFDILGFRHRQ